MNKIWIPYYDKYIDVEISFLVYSLVLVLAKFGFCYTNIRSVTKIAHARTSQSVRSQF